MNKADRFQRIFVGVLLLVLNFFRITWPEFNWKDGLAVGIQMELIFTGIISWCPFYWSLGFYSKKQ